MSEQGKKDLVMLSVHPKDWLPGMTQEEKFAEAQRDHVRAVADRLTPNCARDVETHIPLQDLQAATGATAPTASGAIDAWADGYPGFDGLGLSWAKPYKDNAPTEKRFWNDEPYIEHFPDGCAWRRPAARPSARSRGPARTTPRKTRCSRDSTTQA